MIHLRGWRYLKARPTEHGIVRKVLSGHLLIRDNTLPYTSESSDSLLAAGEVKCSKRPSSHSGPSLCSQRQRDKRGCLSLSPYLFP